MSLPTKDKDYSKRGGLETSDKTAKPVATKSITCVRGCGRKQYDSNGLCVACDYAKMMGFGAVIL